MGDGETRLISESMKPSHLHIPCAYILWLNPKISSLFHYHF